MQDRQEYRIMKLLSLQRGQNDTRRSKAREKIDKSRNGLMAKSYYPLSFNRSENFIMKKNWFKSKTIWGALFLGIEASLQFAGGFEALLAGLGVFLTIAGFRTALK